jgi:hypothetical protein
MRRLIRIDRNLVLRILSRGLGYPVEDNPVVGEVVRLSAREAFVYSVLTSFGYLDPNEPDNMYRLTRGAFRVFNQAEQYELQEGIFSLSDMRFASTVNNEVLRKPYIATGDKFIVPIEYQNYLSFQEYLRTLCKKLQTNGYNINDFIVTPIRRANSGTTSFESFFEFVVSTYFNRREYITDTQIPFFYGIGTPDIAAYKMPSLLSTLKRHRFLSTGGSPIELMAVSVWGFQESKSAIVDEEESIVFEVKTNQLEAPQITKYTETQIFNKAYEVIPCVKKPEKYAGLITTNEFGQLLIYECPNPIPFSAKKQKTYLNWISVYLKMYLLANLRTEELEFLLSENSMVLEREGLLRFIRTVEFDRLVRSVKEILVKRRRS